MLTTSIGLPQKIFNIRRNPEVSLFYSDPTGSRLENPPFVLVHGKASSREEVQSVEGFEDYWETLMSRQPASKIYGFPPMRPFMAWYYMRLVMNVRPARITWWPR